MIVRQKPACRFYKDLSDNGLSIVVELLSAPIVTGLDDGIGDPGYRQPVDMVIGERLSARGSFVLHHVDSRRFEPAAP